MTMKKDWDVLTTHFETAQETLRKICGSTMRSNALMRQANVMREEREQYVNVISAAEHRYMNALESHTPSLTSEKNISHSMVSTPSVNVTISDAMIVKVLKFLNDTKDDRKQPYNPRKRNNNSRNNESRQNNQTSDRR